MLIAKVSTVYEVFLLAICPATRSSELQALDIRDSQMIFRKNGVSMRLIPVFMPKVLKQEFCNGTLELESFFPVYDKDNAQERVWHSMCPVRALFIYLHYTKKSDVRITFNCLSVLLKKENGTNQLEKSLLLSG